MTENDAAKLLRTIPRAIGDLKLIGRLCDHKNSDGRPDYPPFIAECFAGLRSLQDRLEIDFPELCRTSPRRQ